MKIKQKWLPIDKYKIKSPRETEKDTITVHNTANSASAENEASYMIRNTVPVSFHAVVDEKEVIECIPFNRCAFHSGKRKGNDTSYSIEIARSTYRDGTLFDKAEENASEYIAKILKEKGWGVDKVKKHQDWNGKYCPHKTLDKGWERFLNMISEKMGRKTTVSEVEGDYMARVYKNGSTTETVYQDKNLTKVIGMLNKYEKCICIGESDGVYIVEYNIDGTNNKKVGYVKYHG